MVLMYSALQENFIKCIVKCHFNHINRNAAHKVSLWLTSLFIKKMNALSFAELCSHWSATATSDVRAAVYVDWWPIVAPHANQVWNCPAEAEVRAGRILVRCQQQLRHRKPYLSALLTEIIQLRGDGYGPLYRASGRQDHVAAVSTGRDEREGVSSVSEGSGGTTAWCSENSSSTPTVSPASLPGQDRVSPVLRAGSRCQVRPALDTRDRADSWTRPRSGTSSYLFSYLAGTRDADKPY